jgi:hypothetical protein
VGSKDPQSIDFCNKILLVKTTTAHKFTARVIIATERRVSHDGNRKAPVLPEALVFSVLRPIEQICLHSTDGQFVSNQRFGKNLLATRVER